MAEPDDDPSREGEVDLDLAEIEGNAYLRSAEALFGEEWLSDDDAEAYDELSDGRPA